MGKTVDKIKISLAFSKLYFVYKLHLYPKKIIKLMGYKFYFADFNQFYLLFREIFFSQRYYFETSFESPLIIDAGANIGVSALFFKHLYPSSRIICFEPNTESFELLKKNVESNSLKNVELHNVALADYEGTVRLYFDSGTGDMRASLYDYTYSYKSKLATMDVPCKKLSRYMNSRIDLLKIDIEGSEGKVFLDINDKLHLVEEIIMEYHQFNYCNPLSLILRALETGKHLYNIEGAGARSVVDVYSLIIKTKRIK